MKAGACAERRKDSYLSCLLGPERQARTEERNGHCFCQALRLSHAKGDTAGPIYGTRVAFPGRLASPGRRQDPGGSGKTSGCVGLLKLPTQGSPRPEPGWPVPVHPGRKQLTSGRGPQVRAGRSGELGTGTRVQMRPDTRTNRRLLPALCWPRPVMFPVKHHWAERGRVGQWLAEPHGHQSPERSLAGWDGSCLGKERENSRAEEHSLSRPGPAFGQSPHRTWWRGPEELGI